MIGDNQTTRRPIGDNHQRPSKIVPAGAAEMVTDAQIKSKTYGRPDRCGAEAGPYYTREGRLRTPLSEF